MDAVIATANKLSQASIRKMSDAFSKVHYEEVLDTNKWQFPEEFISIYHEPEYQNLTMENRKRLSLLEMVNFFSINIHGEQSLVAEFEKKLYRNKSACEGFDASRYMQHFINEENSHTYMLAEYCFRYYGKLIKIKTMEIKREKMGFDVSELIAYGRTQLLENYLVYMNKYISLADDIGDSARSCNKTHMLDEVRHIAWDKAAIEFYLERLNDKKEDLTLVIQSLEDYKQTVFNLLYNPAIYKEIGLEEPLKLAQRAKKNPARLNSIAEWETCTRQVIETIRGSAGSH